MRDNRDAGESPATGTQSKKLSLTSLAQIAEVIAAVALVVSLIYVGREVQSNTAAIRGASLQAVSASSSEILLRIAADSSLAQVIRMGRQDPSRLTATDSDRFNSFMRQFWLIMQNVYFQNELGTLEPRAWTVYRRIICDAWAMRGAKETWDQHRHVMDSGFAGLVEGCAEE